MKHNIVTNLFVFPGETCPLPMPDDTCFDYELELNLAGKHSNW